LQGYTFPCRFSVMTEDRNWTPARVARLRRAMGLSQAAFAKEMGVRQQTVSEWETGQYRPRGASVRLLGMLAEQRAPYDAAARAPAKEDGSVP
jgi:DNA-binding transcriptional regulator YiaG